MLFVLLELNFIYYSIYISISFFLEILNFFIPTDKDHIDRLYQNIRLTPIVK